MYRTENRTTEQRITHYAQHSDSSTVFNLLTGKKLFDHIEALLPEHRERIFPPTETLSMFIAQTLSADESCQQAVNKASVSRVLNGLKPISINTGSYCKARKRLGLDMIKTLAKTTGKIVTKEACNTWSWNKRRVLLVDGMTVTLSDTKANQKAYPQPNSQKPGLGFPICRTVGLTDLASGALIDAVNGPCKGKGSDEQSMLRSMLDRINAGDVLLGDAFYPSYFLLYELQQRGIDGLFEQLGARKRVTNFSTGIKLGAQDHLIDIKKPKKKPDWVDQEVYDQAPLTLMVRELNMGKGKILVTTLIYPKRVTKKQIVKLYRNRWNIELDIRNIKTTMNMQELKCKTPEMAMRELWVYLLAYNLIRLMMIQSALLVDQIPRQLSFKHTLQIWNVLQNQNVVYDGYSLYQTLLLIGEQIVGLRPGRIEPRALKRRMKPYPLLMKTREEARNDIRLNGHPKKQR